jgi:preprotein translocase subunit SecG
MLIIFAIIMIICAIALGLIVLIQNPKGGGLSGSFGGLGNQLMGVKQTTDVLEKGTWVFAGIIGVLCIISSAFIPKNAGTSSKNDNYFNAPASAPTTPKNTAPLNAAPTTKP